MLGCRELPGDESRRSAQTTERTWTARNYRDVLEKAGSDIRPYAQPQGPETSSGEQSLDDKPSWDGRESTGPRLQWT